jgi:hypothetical protein
VYRALGGRIIVVACATISNVLDSTDELGGWPRGGGARRDPPPESRTVYSIVLKLLRPHPTHSALRSADARRGRVWTMVARRGLRTLVSPYRSLRSTV